MPSILLDTCSFLWMCDSPDNLSELASKIVHDPSNQLFLSVASSWEIIIKASSGSLILPESSDKYVKSRRNRLGISTLEIRESDLSPLLKLPELHKDPFDRVIISQSISRGIPILTPDKLITQYPAQVIW